tara:strand:+ start:253 stop:474 length:222 start_codon:yes stop_codon:yes gene_type:complete
MDIIVSMLIALSAGCITYSIWFACKRLRVYEDRQIEKHFYKRLASEYAQEAEDRGYCEVCGIEYGTKDPCPFH